VHDEDWHAEGLSVGQVAERAGVAATAVRFYERKGLIHSLRTAGNHRAFHSDVLCRIAMIRACQRVGLTLGEIRAVLEGLPRDGAPTARDWDRLSAHLRREARRRIDELERALEELAPPR
jgi:MerR family redox-sensitive transcriptional activator SoxR